MSGRLLPDKDYFERWARDRVIDELKAEGADVVEVTKGDSDAVPFDWLMRLDDGSCIGVEVVRAEDQVQVAHVEKQARSGANVIVGSAEMPWESLRTVVDSKVAKTDRYRAALSQQGEVTELHLAITSGLQQLSFEGVLARHMEAIARSAIGPFDTVWLVRGDAADRIS